MSTTRVEVLSEAECRRLLAEHNVVGRVAFVDGEYPVVLPVNYLLDGNAIAIHTDLGAKSAQHPPAPGRVPGGRWCRALEPQRLERAGPGVRPGRHRRPRPSLRGSAPPGPDDVDSWRAQPLDHHRHPADFRSSHREPHGDHQRGHGVSRRPPLDADRLPAPGRGFERGRVRAVRAGSRSGGLVSSTTAGRPSCRSTTGWTATTSCCGPTGARSSPCYGTGPKCRSRSTPSTRCTGRAGVCWSTAWPPRSSTPPSGEGRGLGRAGVAHRPEAVLDPDRPRARHRTPAAEGVELPGADQPLRPRPPDLRSGRLGAIHAQKPRGLSRRSDRRRIRAGCGKGARRSPA